MTSKFEELAKQATECYSNGEERFFDRDKFAKLIIQDCINIVKDSNGDMDYAIWVLEKYLNVSECNHTWVSAKNLYVKNGSICTECYAVSTKEPNELIVD